LCTRIRTRKICVGAAVVLIVVVAFAIVVGSVVAIVMFEILSLMIVVDDGMTRDEDQAVPE
jgi:hypothetical protein